VYNRSMRIRKIIPILIVFSILLNIGLVLHLGLTKNRDGGNEYNKYPLLSKRIFAENVNDIIINFVPLRSALREYIKSRPDQIGVYFEYLPSGVSIGVNDNMEAALASLVKIPITMATYKTIEEGSVSKNDILTIEKQDIDSKYGNLWERGVGAKLTVFEAIEYALKSKTSTWAMFLRALTCQSTMRAWCPRSPPRIIHRFFEVYTYHRILVGITPMKY
jgi:hypothetical protein